VIEKMPKLPTAEDVKKATQAARTPLYAVLGAGDLATEAVREYVTKVRTETRGQAKDAQTRVNDRVNELQAKVSELQDRLVEVRAQVRTKVGTLPDDVAELRGKLEPAELRHAVESYAQSLQEVYERLAARGESTLDKLRKQPRVAQAIDRVEEVADTAEDRVGKIVEDARELADDVLGRVSRRARSTGEKAAVATEKVAEDVALAVEDAGAEAASTTRSVTRRAANRTAAAKSTTRRTTTTRTGTKA
jgi:heparin binding hemagglutinin HbhA